MFKLFKLFNYVLRPPETTSPLKLSGKFEKYVVIHLKQIALDHFEVRIYGDIFFVCMSV